MPGSRHEKAALVAVAYGIGMLTAFIWFGIGQTESAVFNTDLGTALTASVINTTTTVAPQASVPAALPESVAASASAISYISGVLVVAALNGERVLSFNPEVSTFAYSEDFAVQGTHSGELSYTASPSEEYVFFCEQKTAAAETCSPFVYDVLADTIYPVLKDGQAIGILTSAASKVVWNDQGLMIGSEYSHDVTKPWLLGL